MTDIFISYNHKDEAWKDELQAHLEVLQYHGNFSVWEDRQIKAGDDWYPEIKGAIKDAKVAILLVSRDFLISDFVSSEEIPTLLKRRRENGLRVIPLVIRPCAWRDVPWLASLQGATKDNKPLSRFAFGSFELEQAFSEFTSEVHRQLKAAQAQEESVVQQIVEETLQKPVVKDDAVVRESSPNFLLPDPDSEPKVPGSGGEKSRVWLWGLLSVPVLAGAVFFGAHFVPPIPVGQGHTATGGDPINQAPGNKPTAPAEISESSLDEQLLQVRTWLESEDVTKERLAIKHLEELQERDARAKFMLGAAYYLGIGDVIQDRVQGCKMIKEAAKQGSVMAQEQIDEGLQCK